MSKISLSLLYEIISYGTSLRSKEIETDRQREREREANGHRKRWSIKKTTKKKKKTTLRKREIENERLRGRERDTKQPETTKIWSEREVMQR